MSTRRRAAAPVAALALLAGLVAAVAWLGVRPDLRARLRDRTAPGMGEVRAALLGRGRVVVVGDDALRHVAPAGVEVWSPPRDHAVAAALAGDRADALVDALDAAGVGALLVRPDGAAPPGSLAGRLTRGLPVEGLGAVVLAPRATVVAPRERAPLPAAHAAALGVVARALVGGARPPRISSFPASLRAAGNVEVMVLLRERGRPRLWRSARGSSIARALVTAALVARRRWEERERAMGGPLDARLPQLDVEVSLLEEDGTLAARSAPFVERVFTPAHGVGYERKGAWRYLLPAATAREGGGSAVRAYEALFLEQGLPAGSLERRDLRLYRLIVDELARSPAPGGTRASAPPSTFAD